MGAGVDDKIRVKLADDLVAEPGRAFGLRGRLLDPDDRAPRIPVPVPVGGFGRVGRPLISDLHDKHDRGD